MFRKISEEIANKIIEIMTEYRRQEEENGYVDTPGGLEHMGDVWSLLSSWERRLTHAKKMSSEEGNVDVR